MDRFIFRFFKNFDWSLFIASIFLVIIGITLLFSATTEYTLSSIAIKQSINVFIGLILLLIFSKIDYRFLKPYSGILYIAVIVMLILVKVFGLTVNSAQSWIDLGFFQFQPSTVAQLLLIVILAKYFAEHYDELRYPKAILKSALYVALPTALIALQPDFGSAFVVVVIWGAMLFASNARRIYLAIAGLLAIASGPLIWPFLNEYQKERIFTFLNPMADPMGAGWNVNQAIIAIGSGQIWGRGLGHGTQSQLNYIPEKHTDFIFAMLGEELGLVGISILFILFFIVCYRSIKIALAARDFFGTYIAIGILAMIFTHIFVNVGMNLGLVPVTGIPLPFVSYGGTAIIINLVAVGILENIHRRSKKIDF